MALRITIDIFSGRPNPVIQLEAIEANEALARLRPERRLTREERRPLPASTLGYRGLVIEQTGRPAKGLPKVFRLANGQLFGPGLAHWPTDENFEDFVLGSTGPIRRVVLKENFSEFAVKEKERFRELRSGYIVKAWPWPKRAVCRCGPLYEPAWWNDGGQRQLNNNCYNYATNYRTDTFAQPGLAAGAEYTALTCASVRPAAEQDDLINRPGANNRCPDEGHLVALVIAPGYDFHWYRKGRNGLWTHKPGSTQATNVDNSGRIITDPRTADRGPYTDFCTFMVVMHGHIKIR